MITALLEDYLFVLQVKDEQGNRLDDFRVGPDPSQSRP